MENNVNLNEMKFRRSEEMENQAVTGILSLFTEDTWEETSKKTARQEMALVLSQMRDACILTKFTEDTPEHLMIAHSNEYFNRLINQFESNAPLTVAISGNTFDDMMENLRLIYNAAQNEPYAKEITGRMDIFFQKIFAVEHHFPGIRIFKSADQLGKRRFTGTVSSYDTYHLSLVDRQADISKCLLPFRISEV